MSTGRTRIDIDSVAAGYHVNESHLISVPPNALAIEPRGRRRVRLILEDLLRIPGVRQAEVWYVDPRDAAQAIRPSRVYRDHPIRDDSFPWPIHVMYFGGIGRVPFHAVSDAMARNAQFVARLSTLKQRRSDRPIRFAMVIEKAERKRSLVAFEFMATPARYTRFEVVIAMG